MKLDCSIDISISHRLTVLFEMRHSPSIQTTNIVSQTAVHLLVEGLFLNMLKVHYDELKYHLSKN